MDIQSFSKTYWYIWLLAALVISVILIANIVGFYLYKNRRNQFLQQNYGDNNGSMAMKERSESELSSSTNKNPNEYKHVPEPSVISRRSLMIESPFKTKSVELKSTENVKQALSAKQSTRVENLFNRSSLISGYSVDTALKGEDFDLELEEFQRQALKEHNDMRHTYRKAPLKLSDTLNVYAQYWAEQCAKSNLAMPSRPEWRSHNKGQVVGENIITINSTVHLDGTKFTALIMAHGNYSKEVDCVLNDLTTEVGFGRALTGPQNDKEQSPKWIAVAHYFPYRPLTAVQS